jgi:phage shock protein A
MKTIRRFASGIFTSVEWLADQVENHEALVTAAIRDVEKATARAKVQFKRVQADGSRLRKQLNELREREETWRERAKKIGESDRKKAIECLKRSKRLQELVHDVEEQERRHAATEKSLSQDLVKLDEQLQKLKQKRNILRTRESQAKAISAITKEDSIVFENIDELFDRWESTVAAQEMSGDLLIDSIDLLDLEFSEEEEDETLSEELDKLLSA